MKTFLILTLLTMGASPREAVEHRIEAPSLPQCEEALKLATPGKVFTLRGQTVMVMEAACVEEPV